MSLFDAIIRVIELAKEGMAQGYYPCNDAGNIRKEKDIVAVAKVTKLLSYMKGQE